MRRTLSLAGTCSTLLIALVAAGCGSSDSGDPLAGGTSTGAGGSAGGEGGAGGSVSNGGATTGGKSGSAGSIAQGGGNGGAAAGGRPGGGGSAGSTSSAGQAGAGGEVGGSPAGGASGGASTAGGGAGGASGGVGGASQGGSTGTGGSVTEVMCAVLPPLTTGVCAVTAGDTTKLITGTILTTDHLYRGGQVALDASGTITCVGCDCTASAPTATQISCPTGVVSPGLINPHDHITYTQNHPSPDTGERYEHRHDWRKGLEGHTKISTPGGATVDEITWGELRFLFGGATSTVASRGTVATTGVIRNLDKSADELGLTTAAAYFDVFPLDDSAGTLIPYNEAAPSCAYGSTEETKAAANAEHAYMPHIAEGIESAAENEFFCTSEKNPAFELLQPQSAYIHGVGLTATQYADLADTKTSLIWSPRSNVSLYGDTARVTEAARLGVDIALGTDWIFSGSMNMLRELACADSLNASYFDHYFRDYDLWMMVTANAAHVAGFDGVLGALTAGAVGDIAIFDGSVNTDYRAIIAAAPSDVALVMRAGKPLYGDPESSPRSPMRRRATTCRSAAGRSRRRCALRATSRARRSPSFRPRSAPRPTTSRSAECPTASRAACPPGRRASPAPPSTPARSPRPTATATGSPTRSTTAPTSSTRSARWTQAPSPTRTATASATRATPARSTRTPRPA